MSLNLLDLVKDQVTGHLAKEASSFLGESESGIAKALGGIMPTLLGSTIEKASKPEGASGLMNLLGGLDLGSLGNIAGIFGGGPEKVNGLMNSGSGILDMLMGNKTSGIIDLISGMAGLKSSSTSSLLKMAAPLLMGLIGKQVSGKGLGALTDLLMGQKSNVASALPSGVGSLLGLSSFGDMMGSVNKTASTVSNTVRETVSTTTGGDDNGGGGMGWLKWLLPLLLLAGAGYWMMTKNKAPKMDAVADVIDTMATKVDTMATQVMSAAANFAKEFGVELKGAAENGIENQLIGWVKDAKNTVNDSTWFNFDRLLFDTGKSTLQPASQEQLANMAAILTSFPNVKIKIGGYTDNQGNPKSNLKLSQDRANTVKAELVKLKIDAARMEAKGYGDKHPVGDNATEEGRQQNRRIAVNVTAK
jgi:outer membrane protein OmpA-like peptidoglycan-associated protein